MDKQTIANSNKAYKIIGERTTGKEIYLEYNDLKVAKFEYECFKPVVKWIGLYEVSTNKKIELYVKE